MNIKNLKTISLLLIISLIAVGCNQKKSPVKESQALMGTAAEITVYSEKDRPAVATAFKVMKDIEQSASAYLPDSELNAINQNAGKSPVKVSDRLYDMIERSVHFSEMSGGAFDITIGPIVSLWSIGDKEFIPGKKQIEEKLKLVSYKNIVLDAAQKTVFLLLS